MEQLRLTCECGDEDHLMTLTPCGVPDECFCIEVRAFCQRDSLRERLRRAWYVLRGADTALTEFMLHPADFDRVAEFVKAQKTPYANATVSN
ncbi:MAG: hypothetical protein M0R06_18560 [Sphaerochaeta sp.]|jgi:hypothetical protein|nr:hypothetical protein [Sphaerochaeta sp.]